MTATLEELLNVKVLQRKKERKKGMIKERERKEEKEVTVVVIPSLPELTATTKKLVKLGILNLRDVEKLLKLEREVKSSKVGREEWGFFERTEEREKLKGLVEKLVSKAMEGEGLKIPFFGIKKVAPNVTYYDIKQVERELNEELEGCRFVFEGGVLNVLILKKRGK